MKLSKNWFVMLVAMLFVCLFGTARAVDYTTVGNITTALTDAQASATTVFWAFITLSTAALVAGVLFAFARKGKR